MLFLEVTMLRCYSFHAVEGSHSGLVRRFAKPLFRVTGIEGSNPSPSATSEFRSSQTMLANKKQFTSIDEYIKTFPKDVQSTSRKSGRRYAKRRLTPQKR